MFHHVENSEQLKVLWKDFQDPDLQKQNMKASSSMSAALRATDVLP